MKDILKKYIVLLLLFCFNLIEIFQYFLKKVLNVKQFKQNYKKNSLNIYGKNLNDLYFLEKYKLLEFLSENIGKNISKIKSIFIGNRLRFGNKIITIYKIIFYCQILRCKRIFLDKNKIWFIKREIINKKFHMIIKPIYENNVKNTIIDNTNNFFYYKQYVYPHLNIELFKKEILIFQTFYL